MSGKLAIYPGSFDPFTNGHLNIVERGLKVVDRLIIAVAFNSEKNTLFTAEERVAMIHEVFTGHEKVTVESFTGLLVDYFRVKRADVILRGLRTVSDFEYEFQMAQANRTLAPSVETIFMMTEGAYSYFSSTLIKEIVMLGGSVSRMVPAPVEMRMKEKY